MAEILAQLYDTHNVLTSGPFYTPGNIMGTISTKLMQGDCRKLLKQVGDESIDLIITSPPYADSRSATYGGIKPDKYVEWFLPISLELKRVLKTDGTFVLNIKEKVVNQERHTYVMELIMEMKKQGWLWT